MLYRSLVRTPALLALAGLALVLVLSATQAQAAQPAKVVHLQISLYELREAKEDIRQVKGIAPAERAKILGDLDSAVNKMKEIIKAMGGVPEYIAPKQRPAYDDYRFIRHSIKLLKEAKEQLKTEDGVPVGLRNEGILEMNKCLDHL